MAKICLLANTEKTVHQMKKVHCLTTFMASGNKRGAFLFHKREIFFKWLKFLSVQSLYFTTIVLELR